VQQGVIIPWLGWSTWGIIHGTLFCLITALALLSHLRGACGRWRMAAAAQ
jgi:hypothetical protein